MAQTYYDFEALKKIVPDKGYEDWLNDFSRPNEDKWIKDLVNYCIEKNTTMSLNIHKLTWLFEKNPDLAYKLYVIYIQEENNPMTKNFHSSIAQSSLINFLENIEQLCSWK